MQPVARRAYPAAVVVLGYVLWVPAAFALIMLLASMLLGAMTGLTTGGIEVAIVGVFGIIALPFLALGMFLTRKRRLWRCVTCAYAFERA